MQRLLATLNAFAFTFSATVLFVIVSSAIAPSVTAGELQSKTVIAPEDPYCFSSGFEFSAFGAGALTSGSANELGGGVGLAYYFTPNVGVELSYAVFAFDSEVHTVSADVALRYPVSDACIAPYILMGGGVKTNGSREGLYRLGGGLDVRFPGSNLGVFADGIYNWVDGEANFTIARLGVRIPF